MNKIPNLPVVQMMPFAAIEEKREVLLVTSAPAWNAVKDSLRGLNIAAIVEVTEATTRHWDSLITHHSSPEVVYSVGGGLTADAAKYLAAKLNLPLVVLPTALSVDAFLTAASGIRQNTPFPFGRGAAVRDTCVYYLETKVPDILLLDLETIAKAPASIRAAGITDLLSIATGCWDWQFAHQQGKNPPGMEFLPWVYDNAQSILRGALDCAEAAGRGDKDGLKTLYHCLAMEVQLCNQIGHSRPEEGSEHYFAYAIENEMGRGLPHGDLVGPAILLIARLQGQNTAPLEKALKACHVPLNNISPDLIDRTLKLLPAYCQRHNLAFGIAHTLSLPPFPLGEG